MNIRCENRLKLFKICVCKGADKDDNELEKKVDEEWEKLTEAKKLYKLSSIILNKFKMFLIFIEEFS